MIEQPKTRKIAVFTARNHFAQVNKKGELVVYFRKPLKTLDQRVDAISEDILELGQDMQELARDDPERHRQLLAAINKRNAEFWKDRSQ